MAGPAMTILPQMQGDYYALQNKQALAQALMQQSLQAQPLPQAVGSGGSQNYQVMPKYSAVGGMAELGKALIAAKMQQQAAQGMNAFGQAQMNALTGGQQASPAASGTGGSPDGTTASAGPAQADPQALAQALGGASAGSPQQSQQQPAPAPQGGMLAPGGPMNPNGVPVQAAAMAYLNPASNPEYMKSILSGYAPTDATRMARQGNMDPVAANQGALFKNNFVAPVSGTGILRNPQTMQPMAYNPDTPAGTTPLFDASGNVQRVQPIAGAQGAMQGNAAATAAGAGQYKLTQVWDPASKSMVFRPESDVANATAGATTPASAAIVQTESNGNPNAVSPKGAMGAWQVMPNTKTDPGFGVTPAANNSPAELNRVGKDYYNAMTQRYGSPTVGTIAYNMGPGATDTWLKNGGQFEQLPAETRNYVGKVATLTALNSGAGAPQGAAPSQGGVAAAPPLGAQADIEANVKGQVDTMQKSYQNLQTVRSGAPAALQDLGNMQNLASGKSSAIIGPGMASMAGLVSANAAEYEKSRDNLVTNLGSQLGINSDAAREMVYGSIPSYGAPKQAIANGLQTLQGQVQTRLLKAGYLTDAYTAGDAKAYNQKENQFDQNITPAIANVVTQPPGPQRSAALAAAAKDPQVRARLEWAAQNGVLK